MFGINYINEELLGKGLKYPKVFNKESKSTNICKNIDKVNQSINMILSTKIGTRYFIPSFGSKLYELIFEPNEYIFQDMAELYIKEALSKWEPRITVIAVDCFAVKGTNEVPITIHYKLANSNIDYNYVYPFNRKIMDIN